MSIYATLWKLKFPKGGDDYPGCDWITVTAQGVPAHVGSHESGIGIPCADPFAAFLPPPLLADKASDRELLRAVVLVTEATLKGTARSAQEYVDPLLVLAGGAYAGMSFSELHGRICDVLRGGRPRLVATLAAPDGRMRNIFEDGTSKEWSE